MAETAFSGKKALLGEEHPLALRVLRPLCKLYEKRNEMASAEALYRRILSGTEKTLGKCNTYAIDIMQDLGHFLIAQGQFVEAEKWNLRTLFGRDHTVGHYPTSTLDALNNLIAGYLDSNQNERTRIGVLEARVGSTRKVIGFTSRRYA